MAVIFIFLIMMQILAFIDADGYYRCGIQYNNDTCLHIYQCCSQYGWCGTTIDHCGNGCQNNCIHTDSNTDASTSLPGIIIKDLYYNCKNSKTIHLTFDDGPSLSYTENLLDFLYKKNIKATFFLVGSKINSKKARNIVKRIDIEGHSIGIHTWSHTSLLTLNDQQIKDEILKTENIIKKITRKKPIYFRPPYLDYSEHIHSIVTSLGYTTIMVNIDSFDWKYYQKQDNFKILEIVNNGLLYYNGYILLMHDRLITSNTLIENITNVINDKSYNIVDINGCIY